MNRVDGFSALIIVLCFALLFFVCGIFAGKASQRITYLNQCVEKHGDMPSNKVQQHCLEILEFK